ncbi:MAG: hypothetical protein HY900_05345 [Deltaproteobacteria bacterium]|nr:hypothetical protein [Deltaproteobacteria bacterium]
MITARALKNAPDVLELYQAFLDREDERSGTVVLHHGRVKRPGKQVPDFRSVELQPVGPDSNLTREAFRKGDRCTCNARCAWAKAGERPRSRRTPAFQRLCFPAYAPARLL